MKNKIINGHRGKRIALLIIFLFTNSLMAQEDGSPVSIGAFRTFHSEVLNENRTILVNLPQGYNESKQPYPVLYILYGGQVRGYFAEAVHIVNRLQEASLIPQLLIIGVQNVDRYRDNLPVNQKGEKGGAENFLRFFSEELIPFVEKEYRTETLRILLGPQAGASFGVYTLMEQANLFSATFVTNPFWGQPVSEYLLGKAKVFFSQEGSLKNFLFMTCDTAEMSSPIMAYVNRLTTIVEEGKKTDFTLIINPLGENEIDSRIPSPGLREGLKAFYKEYKFPDEQMVNGLEDLKQYYHNLSNKYGYDIPIPVFTLIRQGDKLQERGKTKEAISIYEYVEEYFPHDLNCYHRLAELYQRKGNYVRAINYYEKFLDRRREPFIEQRLSSLQKYMDNSAAYAVEKSIQNSGVDAGIKKYRELISDNQNQLYFSESEFSTLGTLFVSKGLLDYAIEVFKMNIEMNPQSANAYYKLGEAYRLNKNPEMAITNYEKSLVLNPDNAKVKEMIKKLKNQE